MRVAIVNLTGGGISGGYKKYLKNLLPRLSRHHEIEAILCAAPKNLDAPAWFEEMDHVTFVSCKPFSAFGNKDTDLQDQLDRFRPDVVFVPIERYFKHRDVPVVCMLQNMLPLVPMKHLNIAETIRNHAQKILAHKAMLKAQRIIAISDFVRDFLVREWKISPSKIGVVYHGVCLSQNEKMTAPETVPPEWNGRFIFTAGAIESYRGLEDIIHAVDILKKNGSECKVVIAGSVRHAMISYYNGLQLLADKLGLRENICWAGMLNENEMGWCYKNCSIFVMSSRVEACTMVALEAMSQGCICISADNPCLPEIFKNAAIYYPPKNSQSLANAITFILGRDAIQRKRMAADAKNRAAEFLWENTVNKTVDELKKTTMK